MLTTLPLIAALCVVPGQAGGLTLSEARVTHGILGPAREGTKFLPGDSLFMTFDIDGITADANGKVLYSIGTEVTDANGKVIFRQPAQDLEAINALGGNRLPAYAQVAVGQEQAAGECTLKVTVTDRANKKSQSLTQKFEVLPRDFGLVRLTTSGDAEGQVPAGLLCPGQSLWVSGAVVGFQRGGAAKQPNVARALEVDEPRGFMKAAVDAETDQLLGCAVLGVEGGELMSMLQIAMMARVPSATLREAIFAHPTLAESLNNLFLTLKP